MIFIVVKFQTKPEWTERWPELVASFTAATRAEEGNLRHEEGDHAPLARAQRTLGPDRGRDGQRRPRRPVRADVYGWDGVFRCKWPLISIPFVCARKCE